ncbi:hypothetical protein CC78DRAFT_456743 [Lojkania enalia]|uniref:NACHT domain-containing protein n=1 Tax=Lojkania enalia TaxID=147567 RepID=A0A9P4KF48_9PLEO|nr:hypothetical protein CC78DRAFT_456743 [Didymosphaeria enalia]
MNDFIADTALLNTCQWLAPADPELNHELACKAHHPGTCSWILGMPEFTEWTKNRNDILWVHAIPGAGKTVLSASIIECIRTTLSTNEGLAYYYFDYKHRDQQSIRALFASLVASLILKYPKFYASVESKLNRARSAGRSPATGLLRNLLLDAIAHFETLYIVIDALDECEDREELFQQLFNLPSSTQGNLRIFATSRNNPDIREGFNDVPHLAIEMREAVVQEDIRVFVRAEVADIIKRQKIKIRNEELKDEIINALSEKADGMFQWVRCQVDQLQKLKTDKAIRNSLNKLPKGLDETYSRMLENLQAQHDEEDIIYIQRLLRWLTHAVRPLKVTELAEAIAIEPGQENYEEEAVLTDPMDLLRYGEGLVVLKSGRVHLSHFSVREFLVSPTVQKLTPMFYMGILESNAELASTCLTYLNLNEFSKGDCEGSNNPALWKFLQYASSEWPVHFRKVADYTKRPKELVSSLLSMIPVSSNFKNMIQVSSRNKIDLAGCLPVHYCAANGLLEQLQTLLVQGIDVNCLAGRALNETGGNLLPQKPVHYAARGRRLDIMKLLIQFGAELDAPDLDGKTPLAIAVEEDNIEMAIYLLEEGAIFKDGESIIK